MWTDFSTNFLISSCQFFLKFEFDSFLFSRCLKKCKMKQIYNQKIGFILLWFHNVLKTIKNESRHNDFKISHFVNHHHQIWWQKNDWINYSACLKYSYKPTFIFIDLVLVKWQSIEKNPSTPPRDRAKLTRKIKIKRQRLNNSCNIRPIWKLSIKYYSINSNWSINQLFLKSK